MTPSGEYTIKRYVVNG